MAAGPAIASSCESLSQPHAITHLCNGITSIFKDLTRLGRDLKKVIIVDNSPASYAFHPDNAVSTFSKFIVLAYFQARKISCRKYVV